MNRLRKSDRCPIHGSYVCCGRKPKERSFNRPHRAQRVERIDDPTHPRGYREICSRVELRRRKDALLVKDPTCALCHEKFDDYTEVELEHKEPKGMGGARRDDHIDNLQLAHSRCNFLKGSKRMTEINSETGEVQTDRVEPQTRREVLDQLRVEFHSTTCPHCRALKKDGHTFCADCYFVLPDQMQRDLYKLIGHGYVEAVTNAKGYLQSHRPIQQSA